MGDGEHENESLLVTCYYEDLGLITFPTHPSPPFVKIDDGC